MHVSVFRRVALLAVALLLGAWLRLWFIRTYPQVNGDSLLYGEMAKNLILHGIYGRLQDGLVHPTLIRLPGYPLFLAACFRIFGMENYRAVLYLQAAVDLASCLLVAGCVRLLSGARQAWIALFLAVLCPFTANYVSNALSETLSIFCVALALYGMALLMRRPGTLAISLLAFAFSYAALLRPDGALLAIAFLPAMVVYGARYGYPTGERYGGLRKGLKYAVVCGALALIPFVPWTVRNWNTFHVFEPLAPRYATDPGETTNQGLQRWTKTWLVDFASTYEIYWNVDNDRLDIQAMPSRAFDSAAQYEETRQLFEEHNKTNTLTTEMDARFARLAEERIRANPLRYYVRVPLEKVANMWLRPRVEVLPIELRWWHYWEHYQESYEVFAYEAVNLAYLLLALVGVWRRPPLAGAMLAYMLLRSLLLATIEAPETRYTLECYPMLIVLGAMAFTPKKKPGSIEITR